MDQHSQMIYDEFVENRPLYLTMQEVATKELKKIISDNKMYVVGVESRVKEAKSLEGKLNLKGSKYASLSDITDILGCRVIAFYSDEVDKISALVEKSFDIDWNESVDKRKLYLGSNNDKFGYMSLHYICKIPKSLYYDEAHPEINELRFEIQMRTALQHVWATAYHDTGYKSDVEVPPVYLRQLSRLAGMLEMADESFSNIIKDITEYRRKVTDLIKNGSFDDLSLDGDTFQSYMDINPFEELNKKIASINIAEIAPANTQLYLPVLKKLGFETIADVENFKKEYSDLAYQLALSELADTDIDIISSNIGIQNCCLAYIYQKGYGVAGMKMFFDEILGAKPRNQKSAERAFSELEKIRVI